MLFCLDHESLNESGVLKSLITIVKSLFPFLFLVVSVCLKYQGVLRWVCGISIIVTSSLWTGSLDLYVVSSKSLF